MCQSLPKYSSIFLEYICQSQRRSPWHMFIILVVITVTSAIVAAVLVVFEKLLAFRSRQHSNTPPPAVQYCNETEKDIDIEGFKDKQDLEAPTTKVDYQLKTSSPDHTHSCLMTPYDPIALDTNARISNQLVSMNDLWNSQLYHSIIHAENSGNHALQDFQIWLMLQEQQDRKRKMMMARREQESDSTQVPSPYASTPSTLQAICWQPPAPPCDDLHGAHIPDGGLHAVPPACIDERALQEHQMQLMLLEHQNKKLKMMATQKQDNTQPMSKGPGTPPPPPLNASEPEWLK